MKMLEGRIGRQESVSILVQAMAAICIFSLHTLTVYENGNTTYIWMPLGIALAVAGGLAVRSCMSRTGQSDLIALYRGGLGRLLGCASLLAVAIALLWQCSSLFNHFLSDLHSYIFPTDRYGAVIFWVVLAVAYIAWGGLERIARTGKCIAPLVGFVLLITLFMPVKGYRLYRLFPFPGDTVGAIAGLCLRSFAQMLPVILLTLSLTSALQGERMVRQTIAIAGAVAFVLVLLVQLALGLVFTAEQLANMNMPLFRINMNLLSDGYYLRQDKASVFIWLMAAVPGGAYLLYGFAYLFCKATGGENIRPALLTGTVLLICILLLRREALFGLFEGVQTWISHFGVYLILPPLLLACVVQSVREKRKGGAKQHDA
ncbi:MAG: GerAB/ArcD/ProY family transporter [Clostridia bacterium]|nr:GerAB/ArcD/ProY family transporter [Clostridia bacterium]